MNAFAINSELLNLPAGAFARGHRRIVRHGERTILGFTQGPQRNYLYPVYSPRGFRLTTESPADHPHHNSIWIATDHFHCRFPIEGGRRFEEGTYCFYVNEPFQGRAPARIEETAFTAEELNATTLRVEQDLSWVGPSEWGTPNGKVLATERRITEIFVQDSTYGIRLSSEIMPTKWELQIGPTRHALFGVRVAESMEVREGGTVRAAAGLARIAEISGRRHEWVDYSGPVGGGAVAGITMVPGSEPPAEEWFITDWGTVAINPILTTGRIVSVGDSLRCSLNLLLHDGEPDETEIRRFVRQEPNR